MCMINMKRDNMYNRNLNEIMSIIDFKFWCTAYHLDCWHPRYRSFATISCFPISCFCRCDYDVLVWCYNIGIPDIGITDVVATTTS